MKFSKLAIAMLLASTPATAATWPTSEHDCLAANIYHEARGESLAGQYMVAYVTMERVNSPRYPDTVCAVVKQPAQFSWYKEGKNKYPTLDTGKSWAKACNIATHFILKKPISKINISEGAMYYHGAYMNPFPDWSFRKTYIGRVGKHLFYR